MIKLIREGSTKYPWLLKIIIFLIAVTFMIGMGWFGYESSQQPNAVAIVGPYTVSLEEFRRTYTRMYRFYKDELKQELVDEEELKQQVIQSMVDKKVWLVTADEWDIGMLLNYVLLGVVLGAIMAFAWFEISRSASVDSNFGMNMLKRRLRD